MWRNKHEYDDGGGTQRQWYYKYFLKLNRLVRVAGRAKGCVPDRNFKFAV